MPKSGENTNRIPPVTADDVLKLLMYKRVSVFLNTTNSRGDRHMETGFLRGFSDNWLVIQQDTEKEKPVSELLVLYTASIQSVRRASPVEM